MLTLSIRYVWFTTERSLKNALKHQRLLRMEVDEALAKLGAIGRWHILYYTVISTGCWMIPCFHTLAIIYIGNCTSLYNTRIVIASQS